MSGDLDWAAVTADLKRIEECAQRVVTGDGSLNYAQYETAQKFGDVVPAAERLFRAARTLSHLGSSDQLVTLADLEACLGYPCRTSGRCEEVHAELLAAAWLALFFLGVPFNAPWERALEIADQQGGYARGACMNKAIGDVYRSARVIFRRDFRDEFDKPADKRSVSNLSVWALARRPAVIIPMHALPVPDTGMPDFITMLGRCYAILQLRLYVDTGLPITYLVPQVSLRDAVAHDAWRGGDPYAAMSAWIANIFRVPHEEQRILVEADINLTGGVPTCVLGYKASIYSLEGSQPQQDIGIPLAGNRIAPALADSYRAKLATSKAPPLRWKDAAELGAALRALAA